MRFQAFTPALLVIVGLALLTASTFWPRTPVITALAMITIGATDLTIQRFRESAAYLPVMLLHALTYTGLYGIMAGARIHAAASSPYSGVSGWLLADFACSIVPIWLAIRACIAALQESIVPKY
jgi:hypothetical protein